LFKTDLKVRFVKKSAAGGSLEKKTAQKKMIHEWEKAAKEVFENCSRNLRLQRRC
jgi:hypothetical protein